MQTINMSTTFDSTKRSLQDFLKDVDSGKLKLPDFQRGWVWDDSHILGLLASIAQSFPIGAVMLLQSGNQEVRFKERLVEGVENADPETTENLILDGHVKRQLTVPGPLPHAGMLPSGPAEILSRLRRGTRSSFTGRLDIS